MSAPHETNHLIPPPEGDEDPTQLANMIAARPYLAPDKYLDRLRNIGAIKLDEIVQVADGPTRMAMWEKHANLGKDVFITQRFFCEYVSGRLTCRPGLLAHAGLYPPSASLSDPC